ncbi:hypothetical protein [Paenibacillus gallinarum]|uniref:Uncharacterized protein n=1 Tax=Paenibacillus gallinarum TaxID=2762232 RepID=A0ABR8SYK9_9BACL|nr:hypothetical protein [Paenibacillus gallinarum]MBD7968586.1 hypothetical protein [Paenibacillus gallinarum]
MTIEWYDRRIPASAVSRVAGTFSGPYNTGTRIHGWQDLTLQGTAYVDYRLDEFLGGSAYTRVSAVSIYKNIPESDTGNWFGVYFNDVPTSTPLSLEIYNRQAVAVDVAGNIYN